MFQLFTKTIYAFIVFSMLFACSKSNQTTNPEIEQPDPIDPVEFRFLTLNKRGMYGDPSSITFIDKQGAVQLDKYKTSNGIQIADDPMSAVQIGNSLYVLQSNYWQNSSIQELNPNTLALINKIELNKQFSPLRMVSLAKDSVLLICNDNELDYNVVVGGLQDAEFIRHGFNTGYDLTAVKKSGDKLFLIGTSGYVDFEKKRSQLAVLDVKNISKAGLKIVNDNISIYSHSSDFIEDKNGILWFINDESPLKLCGIDPSTEKIIRTVALPTTLNVMSAIAYCIDNAKENLYLRTKKSFYKVNLINPQTPDEPIYEFLVGQRNFTDLKMTLDGKLLTIDNNISSFAQSAVFEFTINDAKWENTNSYTVDCGANILYIPVN